MLVLFETPAGYSLFQLSDDRGLEKCSDDDVHDRYFGDANMAKQSLAMLSFQPFADTADALRASTAMVEGSVSSSLQSFLKKRLKKVADTALAVADKQLAVSLKDAGVLQKLKVVQNSKTNEVFRGLRQYMDELLANELSADDLKAMQLGLSHSLSRYKLKFSADKVDTMVIQAVGLLDDLDKEINTYAMRVKEWYGWHFPELQALVADSVNYSKLVLLCGLRPSFKESDLSSILEDQVNAAAVQEAAELSMGTDITDFDIINIKALAEQVLSMTEYRTQLFEYLKNRMHALAPNLTILVGELVGARLISHAGSLMNLAKQPASTVQILGAEKALFRALKTKHDTPKYGLIYHASLIGQAAPKHKGKISRVLAAKASLAIRVDALTDDADDRLDTTVGFEGRAKVEARLRQLEGGTFIGGGALTAQKTAKYNPVAARAASGPGYNAGSDMILEVHDNDDDDDENKAAKKDKKKKDKKAKKEKRKSADTNNGGDNDNGGKKRKADDTDAIEGEKKKAKKDKKHKSK